MIFVKCITTTVWTNLRLNEFHTCLCRVFNVFPPQETCFKLDINIVLNQFQFNNKYGPYSESQGYPVLFWMALTFIVWTKQLKTWNILCFREDGTSCRFEMTLKWHVDAYLMTEYQFFKVNYQDVNVVII